MPTYFFPWRMLRVSFKDHWHGGFLKGCRLVLVEFNVSSVYKTKLFYVSTDWYGSSFLKGLRKKTNITIPWASSDLHRVLFVCLFVVEVGFSCNFLWIWNLSWNHSWESFCSLLFHYSPSEFPFPCFGVGIPGCLLEVSTSSNEFLLHQPSYMIQCWMVSHVMLPRFISISQSRIPNTSCFYKLCIYQHTCTRCLNIPTSAYTCIHLVFLLVQKIYFFVLSIFTLFFF